LRLSTFSYIPCEIFIRMSVLCFRDSACNHDDGLSDVISSHPSISCTVSESWLSLSPLPRRSCDCLGWFVCLYVSRVCRKLWMNFPEMFVRFVWDKVGKSSTGLSGLAGVKAWRVHLCRVAGNTVWSHMAHDASYSSEMGSHEELYAPLFNARFPPFRCRFAVAVSVHRCRCRCVSLCLGLSASMIGWPATERNNGKIELDLISTAAFCRLRL